MEKKKFASSLLILGLFTSLLLFSTSCSDNEDDSDNIPTSRFLLSEITDNKWYTIKHEYDFRNRLVKTQKITNGGTDNTLYEYDNNGKLEQVKKSWGSENNFGDVISFKYVKDTIFTSKKTKWETKPLDTLIVNNKGQLIKSLETYPNNTTYTYNKNGSLASSKQTSYYNGSESPSFNISNAYDKGYNSVWGNINMEAWYPIYAGFGFSMVGNIIETTMTYDKETAQSKISYLYNSDRHPSSAIIGNPDSEDAIRYTFKYIEAIKN